MTQLIIIGVYLALLLCLGLFSSRLFRGTSKDFLLASHSIGPFMLLMSIFGTTMTAFALVGSTGEAYKEGVGVYGMLASSSGIIHSLCFFLLGIKVWSLGKKYGYKTQIQFFRDRLESDKIGLLLFPVLVGLVIPYLLIGVMASGTVVEAITEGAFTNAFASTDYGVPSWIGSLVISGVVLVYVFFGGMRGTAWANTFQTIVFMVLGVVTFFMISNKMGGPVEATKKVVEKHPSKLIRGVDPGEQEKYEKKFAEWQTRAWYNWSVDQGKVTLTDEQKATAHATVKPLPPWSKSFRERDAEAVVADKAGLLANLTPEEKLEAEILQDDRVVPDPKPVNFAQMALTAFPKAAWEPKALAYFEKQIGHPSDPGKMTRKQATGRYRASRWAPEETHPMNKWMFLTYFFVPLSVGMFPHLFQHWLTAKSAKSFKLPVVCHPIFIAIVWIPCIMIGIWATSATMPDNPNVPLVPPHFNPNGVLAYVVNQLTTPVLSGFLTAGVLAAIMSSLDSQFLCVGTMFTEDIAIHYGGRERFNDRKEILTARLFIIAIVALTYGFSLLEPRRVFTLGVWTFSGFSALFPLICAALYWKRLTKAGAYACILAAAGSWIWMFVDSGFAEDPNYGLDFSTATEQILVTPATGMIAASTIAMVIVSLLTKPPTEATLNKFFPRAE
ncbi:MAG: sodium:solute symporter family protein [Planctomycetaceae bacterium]